MTKALIFLANLCDRQSALMMSGRGDRCIVNLESFGVDAAIAHVGMAQFAGRSFKVTIEELPKDLTKLDNETSKEPKKRTTKLGRRGT